MKHVSILVPRGEVILSAILDPFKIFSMVNEFLEKSGQPSYYSLDLVGAEQDNPKYGGLFSIRCTRDLHSDAHTDLILVPTVYGDIQVALDNNTDLTNWILAQREKNPNVEIASFCMGAFVLAETGLLDNKKSSTHWIAADQFAQRYPDVQLLSHKIITEDEVVYTSGGAYSFLNLVLHLVEKYNGKEIALWVSKVLEIDYGRNTQSQFAIFNGQRSHEDENILKSQDFIEENFKGKVSVDRLAEVSLLSRRNFIRRFKKATHLTPGEYVQRIRVEAAKRMLESNSSTVSEAMYEVGYNDSKAFRETFRKITGFSPADYKSRYTREPALIG